MISGNQHCVSYDSIKKILYDPALKYPLSTTMMSPLKLITIIKKCLSINNKNNNFDIREIIITNLPIFLSKNVSLDQDYAIIE